MAQNDVVIKLSLDGAESVSQGLSSVGESAGATDSKLKGLATGGLKGAGVALAGFATVAVGAGSALVAGSVKAFADYEQNIGGIETMFGSSMGKMLKYADDAYKTAGLSANSYMESVTSFSAALLQGLGGDTDKAADIANKAMVDMSDNANKFGSNIADIQNAYQGFAKQNYTMLDNLKLGYGGTQSEMARLINDSGVLSDTMQVTAKNVNEVSFDKIIEAIHIMQDRMGIAGTTAKEATETIAGSIGMLQGSWENFITGLGNPDADIQALAGSVIESLQYVIKNIAPVISTIGDSMANLAPEIGTMMGSLVEAISGAIPLVLNAGTGLIQGLITGITSALPGVIEAGVPAITGLVQMIAEQAPALVKAGLQAVANLAQGIAESLPVLVPAVATMITGIVQAIAESLPLLLEAGLQLVSGLTQGLIEALPILVEALPQIITTVLEFLATGMPMVMEASVQLLMGLVEAIPQIVEALTTALPQIIAGITSFFILNLPQIINTGVKLLTSLVQNLPQIISTIVTALPQIINAVVSTLSSLTPVLVIAGVKLFVALIQNLPQIIIAIVSAIPQIVGSLVSAIAGSVGSIISAGYTLLTGLIGNLPGIIGTVVGAIPSVISGIVGAIGAGAGAIVDAGYNLIAGMWSGISSAGSWLYNKVMGWASGLLDGVKSFFGIASPSRVFRDQIGKMIPQGLAIGIEMDSEKATKAITKLNRSVLAEASSLPSLTSSNELVFNAPSPSAVSPSVLPTTTAVAQQPIVARGENVSNVYNITVSVDPSSVEELQTVQEFIDRSAQWAVVL